jgi:ATP-dependent DNA helicase RecG
VIDEQQRFGVAHKAALLEKGRAVHLLLTTATPIPRTLALALYGELDASAHCEAPPGRGPLETHLALGARARAAVLRALDERLAAGERGFWIAPRIGGEGDDEDEESARGAEAAAAAFRRGPLARHGIELVHGRVPFEERAARIARFRAGQARLLVATSVVEVGVDVPEASLLAVDGAERFGLAQLHQLRGRVGRGARPSTCFLLAEPRAAERLGLLARTRDGFAIAEEDLRRRGMGDLAGLRQAGFCLEGLDGPLADPELLALARALVEADPALAARYLGRGRALAAV